MELWGLARLRSEGQASRGGWAGAGALRPRWSLGGPQRVPWGGAPCPACGPEAASLGVPGGSLWIRQPGPLCLSTGGSLAWPPSPEARAVRPMGGGGATVCVCGGGVEGRALQALGRQRAWNVPETIDGRGLALCPAVPFVVRQCSFDELLPGARGQPSMPPVFRKPLAFGPGHTAKPEIHSSRSLGVSSAKPFWVTSGPSALQGGSPAS